MWKQRLIWFLLVLFSALLYLFDNETITLALLIFIIAIPLLFCFFPFVIKDKISISIETDKDITEQNNPVSMIIHVDNKSILSLGLAIITVSCKNERNLDEQIVIINTGLPSKKHKDIPFEINSLYSGKITVNIKQLNITDIFKITKWKTNCHTEGSVNIMPTAFDTCVNFENKLSPDYDSDNYSRIKSGNDPGETTNIREYIPGDSIKNIHWKLSQKTDQLMVRELGLPVANQAMILIDNVISDDFDFEDKDIMLSVLVSVSRAMCSESEHMIGWINPNNGALTVNRINNENDLENTVLQLLSISICSNGYTAANSFISQNTVEGLAHIVIIGAGNDIDTSCFSRAQQITVLAAENDNNKADVSQVSSTIIPFSKENYKSILMNIEI